MERDRLGPYALDRELGSGAMGKVYRATTAGGVVAIKVVHEHLLASEGAVERFRREIEIGKTVRHPNVVQTLDGGEWNGHHFLAMEYVEGQTLQALLRELERLPEELCRHIGCEVAKGLRAIHEAGVVHRDIKPENVLITPDHVVKLMDLGVARMVDEAFRLSQTGAFVGSLHYAAPECFRPALGRPDHRADLHSLGLVLYELATGDAPYAAPDVHSSILRVLEEVPRRAGEVNPQLSPFFEEVVHTLLVKDPRGRFATADDLLTALDPGAEGAWWRARAQALRIETRRPLRRIRVPRETALYGRDAELSKMRALYDRARSGDGQVLLLEGEAGIGKSRLVDEFIGGLQREGADVDFLFGSYPPGGAATASSAFAAAYRAQFGPAGSATYLPDNPVLVPAFDALLRGDTTPQGAEPLDRNSLQACFVRATQSMAKERVVVVLIDDLHFAPEQGDALFASLALGIAGHRVLMIGTTREGGSQEWLSGLTRLDHATQIRVPRLGAKDLVHLLSDALSSERLAVELGARVALKSDGNPFFVFEILRGLREGQYLTRKADGSWATTRMIENLEIPASVRDLVNARVSTLDADDRDLLDAACCWGFEFDPSLLAKALDVAPIPLFKQLAHIERAHRLIRASGRNFVFDHHQVQEALYATIPEILREQYHAALADALEAREHAAEGDATALDGALTVDLCTHFLKGAQGGRALRYLDPALSYLAKGYLSVRAVELAGAALGVPGLLEGTARAETLLVLSGAGGPLELIGHRERQEACAREAEALAQAASDDVLRQRSAVALSAVFWRTARHDDAEVAGRRALDLALSLGDREAEANALGRIGYAFRGRSRLEEARSHFERQRAIYVDLGNTLGEASTVFSLGAVAYSRGRLDEAETYFTRCLEIYQEIGDRRGEASAMGSLGAVLHSRGMLDEAREHHRRHLQLSAEIGNRQGEAAATGNLGVGFIAQGRLAEALEYCERHRELSREIGNRTGEAIATLNLGVIFESEGRLDEARVHFQRYLTLSRQTRDSRGEAVAQYSLGRMHREAGEIADAARRYEACLVLAEKTSDRYVAAATHLALGSVYASAQRDDDALRELSQARDLAGENDFAGVEVLAECELALLPPRNAATALATFAEKQARVEFKERGEARFLLWRATGDAEHLEEAKRMLDETAAQVDDDTRTMMLTNVRLHREIVAAWEAHDERAIDG